MSAAGRRGQFFRRDRRGVRNQRQSLDLVRRTQTAMIEIGQRKLGADLVGRILDVGFPVGFGGREIKLLLVFQGTQRIQLGIVRLALISSPSAGRVSRGGRRNATAPPGNDIMRKKTASSALPAFDVANPRRQLADGSNRHAMAATNTASASPGRDRAVNHGSTSICTSCVPMLWAMSSAVTVSL